MKSKFDWQRWALPCAMLALTGIMSAVDRGRIDLVSVRTAMATLEEKTLNLEQQCVRAEDLFDLKLSVAQLKESVLELKQLLKELKKYN